MKKEQLLAEVEDILRTVPPREAFDRHDQDRIPWLGRALAAIQRWDVEETPFANLAADELRSFYAETISNGFERLMTLLHQARHDLRMETVGPTNVLIQSGRVFDYFDEIRKVLEIARSEVFFVDPYLDAEFVSRYLPHVASGVTIRLLAREKMATLLPAVQAFGQQSHLNLQVRSADHFHDRYLFVDRSSCYQSGASFKDGAKTAPTTLTQITDAFQAMWDTYEGLWSAGKVER